MSLKILKRVLFSLGIISLLIAAILSYQILIDLKTKPPPRPRDITSIELQSWMTIPYIAKTYHYPPDKLFNELKIDPIKNKSTNLQNIADTRQISFSELSDEIKQLLSAPINHE